jgi:hypothetical protein
LPNKKVKQPDHVRIVCEDCLKDLYPKAGTFRLDNTDWKNSHYIKAPIKGNGGDVEHVVFQIIEVNEKGVSASIDCDTIVEGVPPRDTIMHINFEAIEDVG